LGARGEFALTLALTRIRKTRRRGDPESSDLVETQIDRAAQNGPVCSAERVAILRHDGALEVMNAACEAEGGAGPMTRYSA
jgi:hypothetical protein